MVRKSSTCDLQQGLSLVELLVALAIGAMLSFAAMHFFLRSKLSYLQADELARMQENGRYAMRLLAHELVMAGHLGSVLPGSDLPRDLHGSACFDYLLDTTSALGHANDVSASGVAAGDGAPLPADCVLSGQHQTGTDILVVRRTSGSPARIAGASLADIQNDTLYLWVNPDGLAFSLARGGADSGEGELWQYRPAIYFVRSHSRSWGDGIPSLCRKSPSPSSNGMAPTQCLVEGIENLQLAFGIDDDGDLRADRFDPQPGPADLRRAVAARLYLLVRSVHPVAGHLDDRSYTLGGAAIPAAFDSHYRSVMQATVVLRNSGAFRR